MARWIRLFVLFALFPWATAQQQEPTFRVRTEQVTVYVSVTDKKGRPVKNLSKQDFRILEDGVAQQIDLFQEIGWGSGADQLLQPTEAGGNSAGNRPQVIGPRSQPPAHSWRESRFVVIRFDPGVGRTGSKGRFGVSFDKEVGPASGFGRYHEFVRQTKRAMEAAREVVGQLDLSNDYAAISWRNVLTEFSQDKRRLLDLINALDPSKMDRQDAGARLADVVAAEIGGVGSFELSDIFDQPDDRDILFEIDRQIMLGSHFDGADLISRLKYLRGRKVLIYLGEGLPEVDRDDKDLKYFDPRYNARIYSDAGFTVYAISPRGLVFSSGYSAAPPSGSARRGLSPRQRSNLVFRTHTNDAAENVYLKRWTQFTGGAAYYNRNNLKKGVREVFEQASHSYLLAYRINRPEPDGKFHRIQVRLAEGKDRRVRHRNGYFATSVSSAENHYRTVATALMAPSQFQDFPLTVTARRGEGASAVQFQLAFPFEKIRMQERQVPGDKKGEALTRYYQEIRLLVAAFSESGEYLGAYEKKFFLDLDEAQMKHLRLGSATVDRTMNAESGQNPALLKTVVVVGQNEQVTVSVIEVEG